MEDSEKHLEVPIFQLQANSKEYLVIQQNVYEKFGHDKGNSLDSEY